jgi:hypothetical protein
MKHVIKSICVKNIIKFYLNVAKKYKHTYSQDLQRKNILEAYDSMFLIEETLPRRKPTLTRWQKQGWHMANTDKWYYAYTIEGDTITIQDACHAQNMHE